MLPSMGVNSSINPAAVVKKINISIVLLLFFSLLAFNVSSQMRQLYVDADQDNDIRKISLYSVSEGYIAFRKWIGYTTDSGRTFIHKNITMGNVDFNGHPVNLTFGFGISGVKAFNKDTLLVYGNYGFVPAILYSVNQGNSFKLVYLSQLNNGRLTDGITDLVFPENNNIGFAIETDRIIKTYDRGKSWVIIRADPNSYFERVDYVDNNNLYVYNKEYSTPKLLKTTNSGSSWASIAFPISGRVNAVSFINANNGWLNMSNADDNIIYYTGNGGITWRAMTKPAAASFRFVEMRFVNEKIGYALDGSYTVLKTLDSGKVWQPLLRENNFSYLGYSHSQLFTMGSSYVWAGGMYGLLELSTNGGGEPMPRAFFTVDTTNYITTGIVKLENFSNPDYQFQWFVNERLVSDNFNASYNHDIKNFSDIVRLIVTNKGLSDTVVKNINFPVLKFPSISSFSPATAGAGSQVVINGANFTGITGVSFGGTAAASFSIVSDNMILAVVNNGASGDVVIKNIYSSATSPGFTFLAGPLSPPPVITNVTPAYGNIGTAVKISGNNFSPVVDQNLVYFGTIKANVTAASITQIDCLVPPGAIYSDISVLNVSTSLKGVSPKPFSVTFADSTNFTSSSFRVVQKIPWGPSSSFNFDYVNVGDLDGDGKIDLIGGEDVYKNLLHVYLNNCKGRDITFAPTQYVTMNAAKNARLIRDLDGDGKPDIINASGPTLNIIRNKSTPGSLVFENSLSIVNTQQSGVQGMALDDLDGDGRVDIALAGYSNKAMSVLRNTGWPGLISFSPGIGYPYGADSKALPDQLAIADMDGDGKRDIIVLNFLWEPNCSLSYFKNNCTPGTINFANKIDLDVKGSATQLNTLLLRDYDGDGLPDVIICNDIYLQVFVNTSTGGVFSLAAPVYLAANGYQLGGSIANLSGGARPDLVTGNFNSERFSFFRNNSTPGLVKNEPTANLEGYGVSTSYQTAVADFNGDARPDIVGSSPDRGIVVIENSVGLPRETKACIGSDLSLVTDVGGSVCQWQEDKGAGFVNIVDNTSFQGTKTGTLLIKGIPVSWNNYKYRCIVDGLNSTIFQLKMTGPVKPHVTISVPSLEYCKNGPVTFSATWVDAGYNPPYYWQINEKTVVYGDLDNPKNPFITSALNNNDRVRLILQSRDMCSLSQKDTSETLTMVEKGVVPSVSITGPTTTICAGTPVTYVATPVNGGTSPTYRWTLYGLNIGGNSPVLTTAVPNQSEVSVWMTSNSTECNIIGSVNSNIIRPTVYNNSENQVSIQASVNTVCKEQPVTFWADVGGEGSPILEWQVNDTAVSNNGLTYTATGLADSTRIKLIKTTRRQCSYPLSAVSNIITIRKAPVVIPSVSISGDTYIRQGQATLLTAFPVNGGTSPTYKWEDSVSVIGWKPIGNATNATLIFTPTVSGHKVRCTMKNSGVCATVDSAVSNSMIFTIQYVTAIEPVEPDQYGITYFPNPATTTFTIDKLKINDLWETLEIRDVGGKQEMMVSARNKTRVNVPVSQLSKGFYIAVLHAKSGVAVYMKFIKM